MTTLCHARRTQLSTGSGQYLVAITGSGAGPKPGRMAPFRPSLGRVAGPIQTKQNGALLR
jgi:hypothetical protein